MCVQKNFGYMMGGFFDDIQGLGDDNCLVPIPEAIPKEKQFARLIPACCVMQAQEGSCYLRCELKEE